MRFEFATAGRIVFGRGTLKGLSNVAGGFGRSPLLITGSSPERAQPCLQLLNHAGMEAEVFSFKGEPTVEGLRGFAQRARGAGIDLVIGFGGGSAIDMAKAVAALATNPGDPLDYIEVIGKGQELKATPLPCIAIPTTAGSGAEVTRNAVLTSLQHRAKASLRHPAMLPRLAIVDPELTTELSPAVTASTGLDALTQLIEAYVSARANPMTDALCVEGIQRAERSLKRAVENGRDLQAREDMAVASLFGGLALANAGLGAVHGFAAPIGGMFPHAPHGAVCAALLPSAMEINIQALRARSPQHSSLERYQNVARLLIGNDIATPQEGCTWARTLVKDLAIPPLRSYGITESDVDELCERARQSSSMKGNPILLNSEELRQILLEGF